MYRLDFDSTYRSLFKIRILILVNVTIAEAIRGGSLHHPKLLDSALIPSFANWQTLLIKPDQLSLHG